MLVSHHEWDSDTDIGGGGSDVEFGEAHCHRAVEFRVWAPVRVFASVDVVEACQSDAVCASRPQRRMVLRVVCQEIFEGMEVNSEVRVVRGWKLFLALLRMMLFRPRREEV